MLWHAVYLAKQPENVVGCRQDYSKIPITDFLQPNTQNTHMPISVDNSLQAYMILQYHANVLVEIFHCGYTLLWASGKFYPNRQLTRRRWKSWLSQTRVFEQPSFEGVEDFAVAFCTWTIRKTTSNFGVPG